MCYNKPPKFKYLILFILVAFACSLNLSAQSYIKTSSFRSYWQFNANAGTSIFFGDIKQYQIAPVSNYENEWRFAGGALLNKQVSPIFGIRGQFLYGNVAGTRRERNLFFESNYLEFNLNTTIGIRNMFTKYKSTQVWNVYLVIGAGITNFRTELYDLQTKKLVGRQGYSGKSFGGRALQGMIVGGIGLDLRLSDRININLETAHRVLGTDELDATSGGFKYDIYNYSSFGISYKFGGNSKKMKSNENYSYFKPKDKKVKEEGVKTVEFEYNNGPISPPTIDALTIEPVIRTMPVSPPVQEVIVEEVPVEIIINEPVVEGKYIQGLEYRVQIRAKYGNPISINHLSNSYNMPSSDIKENTHNGFYIYTVGSYTTYDQAREQRNYLRSYKGVTDCFVVAFRNGKRLNKLP